jgi:Mg2+ and Co2+ transporter CorA
MIPIPTSSAASERARNDRTESEQRPRQAERVLLLLLLGGLPVPLIQERLGDAQISASPLQGLIDLYKLEDHDYRDMSGSMLEIYLSSVSNRMNDVMRVLTVIATIFTPLTFIAGLYGMNFDRSAGRLNMPELGWPYGYMLVCGVMIAIAVGMLVFFRRKGWF